MILVEERRGIHIHRQQQMHGIIVLYQHAIMGIRGMQIPFIHLIIPFGTQYSTKQH